MTIPDAQNISSSPRPSLAELSRRATVDKSDLTKYSIKTWISSVNKLFEQGDFEYHRHCYDNAYVYYVKGCSILFDVINKHQNVKEAKRDPTYRYLMARMSDDIIPTLEKITAKLQQEDIDNGKDELLMKAMNNYPPVEALDQAPSSPESNQTQSSLDNLPSVPTHAPGKSKPSPIKNTAQPPPPNTFMKMPEPEHISAAPPLPPTTNAVDNFIQLPPPTDFVFPSTLVVEPQELASWISTRGTGGKHPSVLLLDIRPSNVYEQGFIKHKWVAQIEPLVLKRDVLSKKIEESMVLNRDAEQQLFAGRHHFDLVVYYNQNSRKLRDENSLELYNLHVAIYELEFQKILRRAPMLLAGGFDAWKSVVGERGVFRYTTNEQEQNTQNYGQTNSPSYHQNGPHWLKDVVGRGSDQSINYEPVKVHKTVFDYFSYAGTSGNKESMSRYSERNVETPPLRGIFNNSLNRAEIYSPTITMPIPQPAQPYTPDIETFTTKYPEIHTNTSNVPQLPGLTRKKTFIDNPYNGFTNTANNQFEIPPLPPKPSGPSSDTSTTSSNAPPLPPKPSNVYDVQTASPPPSNTYRTAPISDNSFSQMGNVMIGTTGLKNLGNTCFMNSIIQCLSGTIPFARYFISGIFKQHINKDNFLGTGGVLAEAFSTLLRTMWSENYNFISPVLFREALIKFAPQFKGSEQHDSQEFLNFLLDGIHEDCNLIVKRPTPPPESAEEEARFEKLPDWEASGIAWERYLERNSSVVVSLFQGQYRSRLTCLTCHATSTTYNSFMSLSLPIPAKRSGPASVSIYQCLDYFVKEEILDNDDAWNCPRCKARRRASKALTLSKLPDVLLIHLKRFSYDGPFKDKLETIVESPMTGLDLSRYVPRSMFPPNSPPENSSFSYDLYAVSNHFGSLSGGHYTACVRNGYRNEWHNFDDSRFSVCDPSKVLSRAAYNLFYVRSTVK